MNNFTLCAHDIVKCVLVLGTIAVCVAAFSAAMCLVAKHGTLD